MRKVTNQISKLSKNEIQKKIEEYLSKRREIVFAYIFGSFAENKVFNDIDIGIYVDGKIRLFYDIEISRDLERILSVPADIIILNKASSMLIHRISKGTLIKDADFIKREDFLAKNWKLYLDFRPKINDYIEMIKIG